MRNSGNGKGYGMGIGNSGEWEIAALSVHSPLTFYSPAILLIYHPFQLYSLSIICPYPVYFRSLITPGPFLVHSPSIPPSIPVNSQHPNHLYSLLVLSLSFSVNYLSIFCSFPPSIPRPFNQIAHLF